MHIIIFLCIKFNMKKYIFIIPLLFIIYFLTLKEEVKLEEKDEDVEFLVSVNYEGEIYNMTLNDYLIGVVSCEMPALFNDETLKAGAVAARTFYMYNYLNNKEYVAKSSDQCFISKEKMKDNWKENYEKYYDKISSAVINTDNEIITYNDEIIHSYYFSMSNGYTENASYVFNESKPYLVSVSSSWEKSLNSYEKELFVSKEEVKSKLNLNVNDFDITIKSRSESGRVHEVEVLGKVYSGIFFRKTFGLRSTDFDVNKNGEGFVFITRGYGHGVGMSQYGANMMAKEGYSYDEILSYYYKGTKLSKNSV